MSDIRVRKEEIKGIARTRECQCADTENGNADDDACKCGDDCACGWHEEEDEA